MLRHLGDIERLCAVKHFQGSYRCVAVTARYSTPSKILRLPELIEAAVTKVVFRHPVLCVGIILEGGEKPAFVRLDSIELSSYVKYQGVSACIPTKYDEELQTILQVQHSQRWLEMHRCPPWRIIVIQATESSDPNIIFDIVFAYHHALADGISGLIFHKSLLEALNAVKMVEGLSGHITVPEGLTLIPPIESQYRFKVSASAFMRVAFANAKSTWMTLPGKASFRTSNPCTFNQLQNYDSRARIVSVTTSQWAEVIPVCRQHKTTLTGLLHGIIVASLSAHVPEAKRFRAGNAYSLRHLIKESSNEMGAYAFGQLIPFSTKIVRKTRSAKTEGQMISQIWEIARSFSRSMRTELSQLPKGSYIALIPRVTSLHQYFKATLEEPRSETYEISNLGAFDPGPLGQKWNIERVILSQSGHGVGPAVSFNVASVIGGPLTICATWIQGAISEDLVNHVCEDIMKILSSLSQDS